MSRDTTRFVVLIVASFVMLVMAATLPVSGDVAQVTGYPDQKTHLGHNVGDTTIKQRDNESGILLWSAPTTIQTDIGKSDDVDMSNADSNGNLHIAYTDDNELYYARITTRGKVKIHKKIVTEKTTISDVIITTEPIGRSHIIYQTIGGIKPTIKRIIIAPNGTTTLRHTVVSTTAPKRHLADAEVDKFGQIRVLVRAGLKSSHEIELWTLDNNSPAQASHVIRSFGVSYSSDLKSTERLAIRGSKMVIAHLLAEQGGWLWVGTFELSRSGTTQEATFSVNPDTAGILNIAIGPMGRTALSARTGVAILDLSTQNIVAKSKIPKRSETVSLPELVFDQNGRLFVSGKQTGVPTYMRDSQLWQYSSSFILERRSQTMGGQLALNGDGYPSLLSLGDGGTLVYRAMVVRGTTNYDALYTKFESVNKALVKENQRLQQRINELENRSRPVIINVTVAPRGERQAFIAGGKAVVNIHTAGVDLSKLAVQYQGSSYSPGSDGTVAIPLEASGQHTVTISYQNTTETVQLEVNSQTPTAGKQPTTTPTTGKQPTATTAHETTASGGQPGFGFAATALTLISALLVVWLKSKPGESA